MSWKGPIYLVLEQGLKCWWQFWQYCDIDEIFDISRYATLSHLEKMLWCCRENFVTKIEGYLLKIWGEKRWKVNFKNLKFYFIFNVIDG